MTVQAFTIDVPQGVLDRIQRKVLDARIGYAPDVGEPWHYGMSSRYLVELIEYWCAKYDWRAEEQKFNRWPQFRVAIHGIPIHFYHVRPEGQCRPIPILLTHGWPGSVVEFLEVIPRLLAAGFAVVVPSLPGHGWSGRPAAPIGPLKVAAMWRTLMIDVLGYRQFFAQGGDWGSLITTHLGAEHADVVRAIHLNMFLPLPPTSSADTELREYWAHVGSVQQQEGGYRMEHETKPQTIGLALSDHPVGWAAWVVEKFHGWGDTRGDVESRFSKDQLISNLMTYLVNDNVIASIWMYYGRTQETPPPRPVAVPTALSCYPGEFVPYPSRRLAESAFNVVRWTEMPSGGHFAAMEEPGAFATDLIEFFSNLS